MTQKLKHHLDTLSRENAFSGVVKIQRDNETLFEQAVGLANRAFSIANQLDTRFRIASITKMFTAVAVLQLIEQERVTLQTRIKPLLGLDGSGVPENATVFHLLTHTSGMADYFDENQYGMDDFAAMWETIPCQSLRCPADYVPLFIDQPPQFAPGEKFNYNGAGYIVLGLLIEQLSGLSYPGYIQRHIFDVAGMRQTGFFSFADVVTNVAEGYLPVKDETGAIMGWQRNIYATTAHGAPDGGAFSTADNLLAFLAAVRANRLLSSEMTKTFLTPHVLDTVTEDYIWKYGFANWFILDPAGRILRSGHPGEEPGISCRLFSYPQQGVDVVILGNQDGCAGPLGWYLHDWVMEKLP